MRRAECRRATRPSFITGWSALLLLLLLLLVSSTGTISCERHAVVVWLPPQRSRVLRPAVLVAVDCRTAIVSRDSVAIYFPDGGSGAVPICTPLLNARSSSLRTSTSSCLASASTDNYVTNRGMLNTSRITQYEDFFCDFAALWRIFFGVRWRRWHFPPASTFSYRPPKRQTW